MPIFIPAFIVLFVIVPILIERMASDLIGVRRGISRVFMFLIIAALNWEMWQAPPVGTPPKAAAIQARLARP